MRLKYLSVQSGIEPGEVQGDLKVRLMQLLLLAAYHPEHAWGDLVVELLDMLSSRPPSGGVNYVRIFLLYLLQTQDREGIESFQDAWRRHATPVGGDLMTYAQELEERGKRKTQVEVIAGLLQESIGWDVIERVTGINEAQFQVLKQQVEDMNE